MLPNRLSTTAFYLSLLCGAGLSKFTQSYYDHLCNTFDSCQSGNEVDHGSFLNSKCSADQDDSILYEDFDLLQSADFGFKTTKEYEIYRNEDVPFTKEVNILSNFKGRTEQLCGWDLLGENSKILIEIERQPEYYEDIVIHSELSNYRSVTYTSQALGSGNGDVKTILLENVDSLKIRVKTLNKKSNYKIKISKFDPNEYSNKSETYLGLSVFVTGFMIAGMFCIHWIQRKCQKIRAQREENFHKIRLRLRREERIQKAFLNIKSGQYYKIQNKFKHVDCSICFEEFLSESSVSKINKGDHIFHSSGLKSWFNVIQPYEKLTCPLGNSVMQ